MSVPADGVSVLALLHLASTWTMVGLIWLVQVVHYPLFAAVHPSAFPAYHARHMARTSWVVGPPMLLELATALLVTLNPGMPRWLTWLGLGLLAVIWLSTAALQVPLHGELAAKGFNEGTIERLVRTNWIRTTAWTARGLIAGAILLRTLG